MKALVTGAAGFIGSALAEALLDRGIEVLGVDCFTPYYDRAVKEANVATLRTCGAFELAEADLRSAEIDALVAGADVVFHLAGQPGVRLSWADGFPRYVEHNVLATQRLLEAARQANVRRVVYASSSSVYGNAARYPTVEQDLPQPHSPYGVTKLAGEHLCALYSANYGLDTVSLRYFTVYGPRQRPDMAIHRMVEAGLTGRAFSLYGSGKQVRDFTYVSDIVEATMSAAARDVVPGSILNVAGGTSVTVNELIRELETVLERAIDVERTPAQSGDVDITGGDVTAARDALGWEPRVPLVDGLQAQVLWHMQSRFGPG